MKILDPETEAGQDVFFLNLPTISPRRRSLDLFARGQENYKALVQEAETASPDRADRLLTQALRTIDADLKLDHSFSYLSVEDASNPQDERQLNHPSPGWNPRRWTEWTR